MVENREWSNSGWEAIHTKFQGHQSAGSGAEEFKRFLTHGHCGYVGHVIWTISTTLLSLSTCRLYMKLGYNWQSDF